MRNTLLCRFILFTAVTLLCFTADLGSKWYAFQYVGMPGEPFSKDVTCQNPHCGAVMRQGNDFPENVPLEKHFAQGCPRCGNAELTVTPHTIWWIIPHVCGIQTSLNEGALFGIGQGAVTFFSIISILALLGIFIWLFYFYGAQSLFITFIFALMSGGILGNLYDRLGIPGLRWPTLGPDEIGEPVYAVRDWILIMIGSYHWPNFNLADSFMVIGVCLMLAYTLFWDPDRKRTPKNATFTESSPAGTGNTSNLPDDVSTLPRDVIHIS